MGSVGASVAASVGTNVSVGLGDEVSDAGMVAVELRAVGVDWTPHSEESVAQAVNANAVRRRISRFMLAGIIPV
jgi:hypothetical protein